MEQVRVEEVEVMLASGDLVDKAWASAYPLLKEIWDQGLGLNDEMSLEDMQLSVITGASQLWLANTPDRFVAACVTQIIPFRKGYSCDLNLYATVPGYSASIMLWLPMIQDWAVKRGCTHMRAFGRLGWKKVLEKEGFELKSITMCIELKERTIN